MCTKAHAEIRAGSFLLPCVELRLSGLAAMTLPVESSPLPLLLMFLLITKVYRFRASWKNSI